MLESELSLRAKRLEKESAERSRAIRRSRRRKKKLTDRVRLDRERMVREREKMERDMERVSGLIERVNDAYDVAAPSNRRRYLRSPPECSFSKEMKELEERADFRAKLLSKRFALSRAIDLIRSWTCVYCTRLNPHSVSECLSCRSVDVGRAEEAKNKMITMDDLINVLKENDTYNLFKDSDFFCDDEDENV
jgi:hypothetical protein